MSRRVHERQTEVTRGGAISTDQMEKELSKQGSVLQELRRDADDFTHGLHELANLLDVEPPLLLDVLQARDSAEAWAQWPDPIPVEYGGDAVADRSAKYWAEVAKQYGGDNTEEITIEVDFVSEANQRLDPVLSASAIAAGKEFVKDGQAVDHGQTILNIANADKKQNVVYVYNKTMNRLDRWEGMAAGSTITRPFAVRITSGVKYTDAVFTLKTFGGVVGTTEFEWQDEETGAGVVSPGSFLGGAVKGSGYQRQGGYRRLQQGDMPLGANAGDHQLGARAGDHHRAQGPQDQPRDAGARQVGARGGDGDRAFRKPDPGNRRAGLSAIDARVGPSCEDADLLRARGPLHRARSHGERPEPCRRDGLQRPRAHAHRYPARSTAKAIKLASSDTCGRVWVDRVSTEGVDNAVYLQGNLVERWCSARSPAPTTRPTRRSS